MRGKIMAAVIATTVAGFIGATPAIAGDHPDRGNRGHGKRAMGTIESFDGSTLSVALNDTTTWSGPVACDLKVRLEHRGRHARGKGHGNPSRGSVADLKAGAWVLRMKLDDGKVEKIAIRPAPAEETVTAPTSIRFSFEGEDSEGTTEDTTETTTETTTESDESDDDSDDCDSEESDEASADKLRDDAAKEDEEEDADEGDDADDEGSVDSVSTVSEPSVESVDSVDSAADDEGEGSV